jgi:2-octaprenyl-6-methoxyphenol hydroxylase
VTPITAIDISQSGGFGMTRLTAAEHRLPALGYVVSYRALQSALDAALARAGIAVRFGSTARDIGGTSAFASVSLAGGDMLTTRLAAIADGTGTAVAGIKRERREYHQVALTAKIDIDGEHDGCAFERFAAGGPMALLPEGEHYRAVWTMTPQRAERVLALPDDEFVTTLHAHFGGRVSAFTRVTDRQTFPLALEFAHPTIATRIAVVGNAAQALHPVAGQGFNLGLRDAFELARAILDTPRDALGDAPMLRRYARARRPDRLAGIAFTHGLVQLFGTDLPWVRWPRGLALTMLDAIPPVKRAFTHAMLFGLH